VKVALLGLLVACSSQSNSAPAPAEKPIAVEPNPADLRALAAQVDQGKQVFAEQCASCHGDTGAGTDDGPAIVGKQALPVEPRSDAKRTVKFRTGADVYTFVATNMPADDPATLAPEQYAAVVAYVLSANAIKLDKRFDASVAALIVINP
jgi:mono/diheme cytochrome c family protein